jgi:CHAD domain-containing protein
MAVVLQQAFLQYFENQSNVLSDNVFLAQTIYSEKAIHDLRVSIKRIKALFRLIEGLRLTKFNARKQFSKFQDLFLPAGVLRDWQVQAKVLRKYQKELNIEMADYQGFILKAQQKAQHKLDFVLQSLTIDKLIAKKRLKLNSILQKLNDEDIEIQTHRLLEKQFQKARKLNKNIEAPEHLHDIRKIVKAAYYTLTLIYKHKLNLSQSKPFQILKNIEEMIGDWHDRYVLQERIRRFIRVERGEILLEYQKLFTQLELENQELIANIQLLVYQKLSLSQILEAELSASYKPI